MDAAHKYSKRHALLAKQPTPRAMPLEKWQSEATNLLRIDMLACRGFPRAIEGAACTTAEAEALIENK